MTQKKSYTIVAIDEAGRGPLAGPIAVAAVAATVNPKSEIRNPKQNSKFKILNSKFLKGIRDSKKLSPKQRGEWLEILKPNFECKATLVGPAIIDREGITRATKRAIARILRRFPKKPDLVLLDGLLRAPAHYNQKTVIKGDEKIPLISSASIVAKEYRDKKMRRLDKIYPQYKLSQHKGYGTKMHYKMLKKHGISPIHRRYFLRKITG